MKTSAHPVIPQSGTHAWQASLDTEENLLICLSRPRRLFAGVADDCRSILKRGVNSERLVSLAVGHAVFPLVYRNLKSLGDDSASPLISALHAYYHSSMRNGLLLSHTLFDLQKNLAQVDVEAIVHKGVVVASQYYGELADRVFGDLDIFVRKADVQKTAELLDSLGFGLVDPLPLKVEDWWTTYRPWQNPHGNAVGFAKLLGSQDQIDVDLQWGLAPHYFTLDLRPEPLWDRIQTVSVLDQAVKTFSPEDTFLLLCLHGAKHSWTELRQVVDIAAFLSAEPNLSWDSVLADAERAKCKRIVLLAARLGSDLQGVVLPEDVFQMTRSDEVTDLFNRIVEWRFAERLGRIGRFNQSVSFHFRARDRRRDCIGTVFHDIQLAISSG